MGFPTRAPFHRRATPAVCSALTVDDMASASRGAKCSSMNRDPLSPSGVSASSIRDMRLIAVLTQKSGSSILSTYTSEKEGASASLQTRAHTLKLARERRLSHRSRRRRSQHRRGGRRLCSAACRNRRTRRPRLARRRAACARCGRPPCRALPGGFAATSRSSCRR